MENRSRLLVIVLVAVLALVVGFSAGALVNNDGASSGASPSAVAQASASAAATPSDASDEPDAESPEASESPVSTAGTPVPPTATPAPTATLTFSELFLDATENPDGTDRVITWVGETGDVTASISSVTPVGATIMCLKTPTKALGCKTTDDGTLTANTTKPRETYILTLRGEGIAQPVVNVTLAFPARSPKVTIENARFDGTSYPETNGVQAFVAPRQDGDVRVVAEWGGKPFLYELDVIEQGGTGSAVIQPDESSVRTDTTVPVTAPNAWKVSLQNIESGFGVTPMTASISWP